MDISREISGSELAAVHLEYPEEIHSAWRDGSNSDLEARAARCYLLVAGKTYIVEPVEVPIEGEYPALGISMREGGAISDGCEPFSKITDQLPAVVGSVTGSDSLGEGQMSQYKLTLKGGNCLVLKHVYPPMTLGLKLC